jgi:signal-transduction protein with cAMP-binding, CBS, and nucleotidyltransferase domain
MPVLKAMEVMTRENVKELAVVSDGHSEGIFSRLQVLRFLHIYSGLGSPHQRAASSASVTTRLAPRAEPSQC